MPSVRVINEQGEEVEQQVVSRSASVVPNEGETFSPAVVERVEYDHSGQSSSITTVCGETENRRESDKKPDMTIEGVLTEPQLAEAKELKEGQQITLISDVHQGQVFVKRLTITQEPDLLYYVENGEEELAFSFQLQLKQPE
jgi:ABC-type lipoprotein release transport system permease subunit